MHYWCKCQKKIPDGWGFRTVKRSQEENIHEQCEIFWSLGDFQLLVTCHHTPPPVSWGNWGNWWLPKTRSHSSFQLSSCFLMWTSRGLGGSQLITTFPNICWLCLGMRNVARMLLSLVSFYLLQCMLQHRYQSLHALSNCIWIPWHIDDLITAPKEWLDLNRTSGTKNWQNRRENGTCVSTKYKIS